MLQKIPCVIFLNVNLAGSDVHPVRGNLSLLKEKHESKTKIQILAAYDDDGGSWTQHQIEQNSKEYDGGGGQKIRRTETNRFTKYEENKPCNYSYKSESSLHPDVLPLLIGEINKNPSLRIKP